MVAGGQSGGGTVSVRLGVGAGPLEGDSVRKRCEQHLPTSIASFRLGGR